MRTVIWLVAGLVGVGAVSALTALGPVTAVIGAVASVVVYWAVTKYIAKRPAPEIARAGAGREWARGSAVGAGFVLFAALVIALFGGYSFSGSGEFLGVFFSAAATALGAAVAEELMFRGLLLQALEKWLGKWAALGITSALFGFMHLTNPSATVWSSIAIACEAGMLLGAAFLWRRNIWFVAGLHWAWNTVVALLGIPVSGFAMPGWFTTEVSGPAFLTGGGFGIEASVVPVLLGLGIAVWMLRRPKLV
ncbi:type II CAAX endopeptidase family protein [Lentzea sp. NPDC051838]|uniref:CPBP family intramembrane glutamic endopeptidase n=1 Tax=Lentzea sp. NPDC051838 TaxID=3154849 RepID=UPI003428F4E2